MNPAVVTANEIVKLAKAQDFPISQLKLQKILYLANGISWKRQDQKLINERFEAWPLGPVVQNVYDAFKIYKGNEIKAPSNERILVGNSMVLPSSVNIDDNSLSAINEAWESAKNLDPFVLSAWSHNTGSPWDKAYNGIPKRVYISDDDIKTYFNSFIND